MKSDEHIFFDPDEQKQKKCHHDPNGMKHTFGIVIVSMTRRFTVRVYIEGRRCRLKLNVINKILLFDDLILKLRVTIDLFVIN